MPDSRPAKQLPLGLRKQLLLARIAVDRVEFVQAVENVTEQVHPGRLLRHALAGSVGGVLQPASWVRLFGLTRRYPYLGSALGTAASLLLRRRAVRGVVARLLRLGLAGGAIYGLVQFARAASRRDDPAD